MYAAVLRFSDKAWHKSVVILCGFPDAKIERVLPGQPTGDDFPGTFIATHAVMRNGDYVGCFTKYGYFEQSNANSRYSDLAVLRIQITLRLFSSVFPFLGGAMTIGILLASKGRSVASDAATVPAEPTTILIPDPQVILPPQ